MSLAALAYVTNWHLIAGDQSYFETVGRPSLFMHLWSLAIEEQFYLLWPLVLSILLLAVGGRPGAHRGGRLALGRLDGGAVPARNRSALACTTARTPD